MSPELEQRLRVAHPLVFRTRRKSAPLVAYGIECGDGWYQLLDVLCGALSSGVEQARTDLEYANGPAAIERAEAKLALARTHVPMALQVKEKFGLLRFYAAGANQRQSAYVEFAERMSGWVCEECGAPGQVRHTGWLRTLCDVHAEPKPEA